MSNSGRRIARRSTPRGQATVGAAALQVLRSARVTLHGHGLRLRLLYGLLAAGQAPGTHEVWLRRYRCVRCGAITTVGPRGLLRGHLYGVGTILVALWLWAMLGWPAAEVRDALRPWGHSGLGCAGRWSSLGRWARELPWPSTLRLPPALSLRGMARRRVQVALSYAPTGPPDMAGVMAGAAHVA